MNDLVMKITLISVFYMNDSLSWIHNNIQQRFSEFMVSLFHTEFWF